MQNSHGTTCRIVMEQHAVTEIERRCKQIMESYEERITSLENKCDEDKVKEIVREEIKNCNDDMVKMMVKEEVGKIEAPITEESCNEEKVKAIITEEISKIQKPDNKGDSDSTNNEVDKAANPITRKETVTNVLEEINKRKSRENNLIVFGIPEVDDDSKEVRENTDKEKLNELFKDCKIQLDKENLKTDFKNVKTDNFTVLPKLSCIYTNADQLFNKLPELIVRTRDDKPKIIGITEVKPKNNRYKPGISEYSLADVSDYNMFGNLQENFLFQHVTRPTRWRGTNTPHTLDLILTNEENMISNLEYQSPLGKSDHCTMKFDFSCYTNIKSKPKIIKLFSRGNYIKIKEELDNIKWSELLQKENDINENWRSVLRV
ncbi:unnamed protein product [Mytilus coruscus]|uniref:Endonuclease/exonuclease/phosphatase domain-containing protein n=1 Tax=Mytilus coruscus TaxID=42192 RepID=A0A6J8BVE2_MYTCO|nr:unnamed protein product [Mytilus coruscus]